VKYAVKPDQSLEMRYEHDSITVAALRLGIIVVTKEAVTERKDPDKAFDNSNVACC
jgi:hypothetical protein